MGDRAFLFDGFLSHSAKDKAVVRPLAERLGQDGLKVRYAEKIEQLRDTRGIPHVLSDTDSGAM